MIKITKGPSAPGRILVYTPKDNNLVWLSLNKNDCVHKYEADNHSDAGSILLHFYILCFESFSLKLIVTFLQSLFW